MSVENSLTNTLTSLETLSGQLIKRKHKLSENNQGCNGSKSAYLKKKHEILDGLIGIVDSLHGIRSCRPTENFKDEGVEDFTGSGKLYESIIDEYIFNIRTRINKIFAYTEGADIQSTIAKVADNLAFINEDFHKVEQAFNLFKEYNDRIYCIVGEYNDCRCYLRSLRINEIKLRHFMSCSASERGPIESNDYQAALSNKRMYEVLIDGCLCDMDKYKRGIEAQRQAFLLALRKMALPFSLSQLSLFKKPLQMRTSVDKNCLAGNSELKSVNFRS